MGEKNLSRFSYEPILDDKGQSHVAELKPLDIARFKALAPYDCLTADYIAALSGTTNEKAVTHRFNILKREPNRWIDIYQPMLDDWKHYRLDNLAYSISGRAKDYLYYHDALRPKHGFSGHLVHRLMSQWIYASFEIAIFQGAAAKIITFAEIIADERTPSAPRKDKHPYRIPLRSGGKTEYIYPDAHPFALETDEHSLLFLEADCHTADTNSKSDSDIDTKFSKYITALQNDIIRDRYGFSKAYVLFVTISTRHMQNVMAHLAELTRDKPSLRKRFLFKRHPSLKSDDKPRATGHMLTEPWHRAELPMFDLLNGKEMI